VPACLYPCHQFSLVLPASILQVPPAGIFPILPAGIVPVLPAFILPVLPAASLHNVCCWSPFPASVLVYSSTSHP
jgi:hypothetical protein